MVEKKIGFHSNTFKNEYNLKLKETNQRYVNVFQQENPNQATFTASNEYNGLNEIFSNSFIWRLGKYRVKYKVYILKRDKPFEKEVSFELSNIQKCNKHIELTYKLVDEEVPFFDWVNVKSE